jgi:hypothetical protein
VVVNVYRYQLRTEGEFTTLILNGKEYGPFGDEETAREKLDELCKESPRQEAA